jgi:hypothetical protein
MKPPMVECSTRDTPYRFGRGSFEMFGKRAVHSDGRRYTDNLAVPHRGKTGAAGTDSACADPPV